MSSQSSSSQPSKLPTGLSPGLQNYQNNFQMANVIQSFRPNRSSPIIAQPTIISGTTQNIRFQMNSSFGAPRFPTPRLAPQIRVINNAGNLVGRPGFLSIRTVPSPQQQSPSQQSGMSCIYMAPQVSKSSIPQNYNQHQSQIPPVPKPASFTAQQSSTIMKDDSVSSADSAAVDGNEFVSDVPVAAAMEIVDESGSGHATAVGGVDGEVIAEDTESIVRSSIQSQQVMLVGPKAGGPQFVAGPPVTSFQGGFHQIPGIRPVPFQIRASSQTPLATGYYATSSQFSHLVRPSNGHTHSGRFCLNQERPQQGSNQKRPCNCTKSSCLKLYAFYFLLRFLGLFYT